MYRPVAPDLDPGHLDLFGERAAVGPDARVTERAVAVALHDLVAPAAFDGAAAPAASGHERLQVSKSVL